MRQTKLHAQLACLATLTGALIACSPEQAQQAANQLNGANNPNTTTASKPTLAAPTIELAQTHVLPTGGRSWALTNAQENLHFTGNRTTLALVRTDQTLTSPYLQGFVNGVSVGKIILKPPAQLPLTENNGESYARNAYSALIPAKWLKIGLTLRILSNEYEPTTPVPVNVGANTAMTLRILPFYIFGATETNTNKPLSTIGTVDATLKAQLFAKWPISQLTAGNHPARKVVFPYLVVSPRTDRHGTAQPAYIARSTEDYKDGFAGMSAQLGFLSRMRAANGEANLATLYYTPLISVNKAGAYQGTGGGLGGGSVGVGDDAYRGIFIHEIGHALGLPHVGSAFDGGKYPYDWGNLNGSAWGWDQNTQQFLAPFMPTTAEYYAGCSSDTFGGHTRKLDHASRCIKQDPMQSGSGDQSSDQRFATFSDYSTAVMQRYFETKIVADSTFPDGYKQWDIQNKQWVNVKPTTRYGGIFELDGGLPIQKNVPVYAIGVTISNAGTAGATQIYPPIKYTGNLMRTFDPSNAADRASFVPDTSDIYYWYCRSGGCDYTLKLTYATGTVRHVLLQGGFRPWNQARGTPSATTQNPRHGDSFKQFVVNVPNEGTLQKIELLSTPMAWEGLPANPQVLAVR